MADLVMIMSSVCVCVCVIVRVVGPSARGKLCSTSYCLYLTLLITLNSLHLSLQVAQAQGLTRAIGVSNFKQNDFYTLLANKGTKLTPAVNQIELHVGGVDNATIDYCRSKGIVVMAFSPMGGPDRGGKAVYDLPEVIKVAAAHNKTGAQVSEIGTVKRVCYRVVP